MSMPEIEAIVIACLEEVIGSRAEDEAIEIGSESRLIGKSAVIDSLGLVTLLVDLEQRLDEELGYALTLADERAMSQKSSPFRSVGTLSDYIRLLAEEEREDGES